jgi:O-antigen/teichoic acid export membrane protein
MYKLMQFKKFFNLNLVSTIFNNVINDGVIKNISKLASGALLSQFIMFITIPVLTRIYSPEEYGIQGLFLSVVSIASVIITLNYHQAIPLEKTSRELESMAGISLYFSIIFTFILLVGCVIWIFYGGRMEAAFLPIGAFLLSVILVLEMLCYKLKMFNLQVKSQVSFAIVGQSLKIILGFFHAFGLTLLLSVIIAYISKCLILIIGVNKKINLSNVFLKRNDGVRCTSLMKKHSSLPLYRMPQTLITALAINLPIYVLATNYGLSESGYYSLAIGVLGVPLVLIGNSVTNVLFPRMAELNIQDSSLMFKYACNFMTLMGVITALPFVVFYLYSENLFLIVFGEVWVEAGVYASALCIQYFFTILSRPVVVAITILNRNRFYLYFEVFSSVVKLLTVFLVFYSGLSARDLVFSYSYVASMMYVILILWFIFRFKKESDLKVVESDND